MLVIYEKSTLNFGLVTLCWGGAMSSLVTPQLMGGSGCRSPGAGRCREAGGVFSPSGRLSEGEPGPGSVKGLKVTVTGEPLVVGRHIKASVDVF